jgi:hypothetical protein
MSSVLTFPDADGFPKIIWQDSNDALMDACAGIMTQYVGDDGGVKSAASEVFPRHKLAEYRPPKGHFMMHIIAMGSEEAYGPNRNGDGFSKRALQEYHPTFVSDGHMFREHRNRDPKLAIGQIKASAYNPDQQRVELILWGDCEKAAGEYERLRKGDPLSGSMSCRVPYDVCNCCQNQAKSAAVYCDHLKRHMLQYLPEFKKYAFAQNPKPRFFDYSTVERPADRIAHALQWHVGELTKAASSGEIMSGSDWANVLGVNLPYDVSRQPLSAAKLRMLEKLAKLEAQAEAWLDAAGSTNADAQYFQHVAMNAFHTRDEMDMRKAATLQPGTFFRELAKRACLLSPVALLSYVGNQAPGEIEISDGMRTGMKTLFRDLHKQACCEGGIGNLSNLCDPGSKLQADVDPAYEDSIDQLMGVADELLGVSPERLAPRTINITIIKKAGRATFSTAQPTPTDRAALDLYGTYKLAALTAMPELTGHLWDDRLALLAIAQNFRQAEVN